MEIGAALCALAWEGLGLFGQRIMCNASEAKERFAKLKQSFNTVLLKEKCNLSTGSTG